MADVTTQGMKQEPSRHLEIEPHTGHGAIKDNLNDSQIHGLLNAGYNSVHITAQEEHKQGDGLKIGDLGRELAERRAEHAGLHGQDREDFVNGHVEALTAERGDVPAPTSHIEHARAIIGGIETGAVNGVDLAEYDQAKEAAQVKDADQGQAIEANPQADGPAGRVIGSPVEADMSQFAPKESFWDKVKGGVADKIEQLRGNLPTNDERIEALNADRAAQVKDAGQADGPVVEGGSIEYDPKTSTFTEEGPKQEKGADQAHPAQGQTVESVTVSAAAPMQHQAVNMAPTRERVETAALIQGQEPEAHPAEIVTGKDQDGTTPAPTGPEFTAPTGPIVQSGVDAETPAIPVQGQDEPGVIILEEPTKEATPEPIPAGPTDQNKDAGQGQPAEIVTDQGGTAPTVHPGNDGWTEEREWAEQQADFQRENLADLGFDPITGWGEETDLEADISDGNGELMNFHLERLVEADKAANTSIVTDPLALDVQTDAALEELAADIDRAGKPNDQADATQGQTVEAAEATQEEKAAWSAYDDRDNGRDALVEDLAGPAHFDKEALEQLHTAGIRSVTLDQEDGTRKTVDVQAELSVERALEKAGSPEEATAIRAQPRDEAIYAELTKELAEQPTYQDNEATRAHVGEILKAGLHDADGEKVYAEKAEPTFAEWAKGVAEHGAAQRGEAAPAPDQAQPTKALEDYYAAHPAEKPGSNIFRSEAPQDMSVLGKPVRGWTAEDQPRPSSAQEQLGRHIGGMEQVKQSNDTQKKGFGDSLSVIDVAIKAADAIKAAPGAAVKTWDALKAAPGNAKDAWSKLTSKQPEPQPEKVGLESNNPGNREAPEDRPKAPDYNGPGRTLLVEPGERYMLQLNEGMTHKEFAAADKAGYKEILHKNIHGEQTRLDVQEGLAKSQGEGGPSLAQLRERVANTPVPENHATNGNKIFSTRIQLNEEDLGRGPKGAGPGLPGREMSLKGLTHEPIVESVKFKDLSALGYDRVGLEGGQKQDVQLVAAKFEIHGKYGKGKNEVERVERAEMVQEKAAALKTQDLKGEPPTNHGENAKDNLKLNTKDMAPEQMAKIEASGQKVFSSNDIAKATSDQDNSKSLDKTDTGRRK